MRLLLFITLLTSSISSATSQCVEPGDVEMTLQERLYQADIILYGKDRALEGARCPFENPNCAKAPADSRQYSNFQVYCVIKNNGPPVPNNITIYPKKYGDQCSKTHFPQGVSGWVHIVTVNYEGGEYYWDEINNMAGYTTIYVVDTDPKLLEAARLCNLPVPVLPEGGSEVGCPEVFNKTQHPSTCFKGCERGWKPIGDSCYWFSDYKTSITRNAAATECLLKDSHLVAIETQAEETELTFILNEHMDTEWWSSGARMDQGWIWQDGILDTPFTFTKWRQREPTKEPEANYMAILYRRDKWGWRATKSDLRLPYICEKDRGELPPITTAICEDKSLQATQQGKAQCSLAVYKLILTSSPLWVNTSQAQILCRGKTAYDDINCLRDIRRTDNIITQLLNQSEFNPFIPRQELKLSFASLPGKLEVCGQQYSWPQTTIVTPHIDDMTPYDSWYFRPESKMAAQWEASPNTLYALIIIDLGLYAVHGAWVNIPGGNITNGEVLQQYVPLAVATPDVPASFVFLVFKQKSPAFLNDAILKMLTYSPGRHDDFNITELSNEIGFEDLVAINFVSVQSDPYSSWYFEQRPGFSNHCPHYIQLAYQDLDAPVLPPKSTFSVITDVTFQVGEETWTMCCNSFSASASSTHLNPYGSEILNLGTENVRAAPFINLTLGNVLFDGRDKQEIFKDNWYTVVMVDLGVVANTAQPTQQSNPLLHWLVTDIPDGDVTVGKTIVPYKVPAPVDKYKHFYIIYILKQKGQLGVINLQSFSKENCTSFIRCAFDLQDFLLSYDLEVAGANWFTVEADTYAIYELIRTKNASPADACKKMFPETRTYGPLVVCETPRPQQPSVRPIIGSATCTQPLMSLTMFMTVFLMLRTQR